MPQAMDLTQLRQAIDAVDQQLLTLLNQRAQFAQQVAKVKQAELDLNHAKQTIQFYRPEREAQVLRQIQANNSGPMANKDIAHLFREIMSICLALEQPLTIAYLGPEGTFTQQAVFKHFGRAVHSKPYTGIAEVFQAVESESCNYGVVPIENSTEGMVNYTLDLLQDFPLIICGEVELKIHHCLIGQMDSLADIKTLVSHQQSLAQCRQWLSQNLACVPQQETNSNAQAAQLAQQNPSVAAIASQVNCGIYNLKLLAKNIEDNSNNTTRFLILGRQAVPPSGNDKTSLLLATHNKPGALYHLLAVFAQHQVSMTRIESRPAKQNLWEYIFFIDIEGHQQNPIIQQILIELETKTTLLKILGSYPKTVITS